MAPGRIPAPGVIILAAYTFESSGLVNRHRTAPVLVLLGWILDGRT